jgi:hypothetical protein
VLYIYRETSPGIYTRIKRVDDDTDLAPMRFTHDGELGSTVENRLYVGNDDETEYYTYITVYPESTTSQDDVSGTATGWGVKLAAGSVQPTEAEWDATDYGNTISISNIGTVSVSDIDTKLPFWVRVECPPGTPADTKTNIALTISSTGNAVT